MRDEMRGETREETIGGTREETREEKIGETIGETIEEMRGETIEGRIGEMIEGIMIVDTKMTIETGGTEVKLVIILKIKFHIPVMQTWLYIRFYPFCKFLFSCSLFLDDDQQACIRSGDLI